MIMLVPVDKVIKLAHNKEFFDEVVILDHRNFNKRELKKSKNIIKIITKWLVGNEFTHIAGPVLSGAALAFAIAIESDGKIFPIYLAKPSNLYKPIHHEDSHFFKKRGEKVKIAFIDDRISSGDTFRAAEKDAKEKDVPKFEAIISWFSWPEGLDDKYKGKLYTIVDRKLNTVFRKNK